MRKLLAAALALCAPWPLAAQNAITQEGTVLQNSPMMFRGNNRARQGAPVGGAPTGQIVTTGDAVVGGRCDYSAPIDASGGYAKLCISAKDGSIELGGTNPPTTLKIIINGTVYELPLSVAIVGSDAVVANNVALKAITSTTDKRLTRLGFAAIGDGGLAAYNWSATNCTAADDGAQVQPSGTGCWIADFSGQMPTPMVWGAKGDGTTDDTLAFQAALTARAGQYLWQGDGTYRIGSVTIPAGTTLKGNYANTGAPNYHNTAYNFASVPAIRLSSADMITALDGATIDGILLYRYGMTFPAPNSSAYAGTAIEVNGDSVTLKNSMVMGFDLAVTAGFGLDGRDKGLIENVNFDNQNNIWINASADTWRIRNIHAWPWGSASPTATSAAYYRTGTNFRQSESNDASLISDYLAFGYKTSFAWHNTGGSTCTNCDADGDKDQPDVVAFSITGANARTTLINPKSYGRYTGIYILTTGIGETNTVNVIGGIIAGAEGYGVQVISGSIGSLLMNGVDFGSVNYAMQIASSTQAVFLSNNRIGSAFQAVPINVPIATSNIFVSSNNNLGDPVANAGRTIMTSNASVPTIAIAAGSLSLPPTGNIFQVSDGGTTTSLNGEWAGRVVTLVFKGVTTINNTIGGGFGTVMLNGSANFVSTANSTLTVVASGGALGWYEVGRMKP